MSEGKRYTILVIEDDKALRDGLAMNFDLNGYHVHIAADGEEGLRKAFDLRPDLIVLDIMLPDRSGLDILSELRERRKKVPVLILSARDATPDKVEGLKLGADDYLTKPFELPELLARVQAMLRRRQIDGPGEPELSYGEVRLDPERRRVTLRGDEVTLSAKEFDLLHLLMRSPGRPYSREEIVDRIWGYGFDGTPRTVDNYILNLRQKLEDDSTRPRHIVTVRQVGYKLQV